MKKHTNTEFTDISEEKALAELKKGYADAEKILKKEDKIQKLLSDIEKKMKKIPMVGDKFAYVPIFASMLNDYFKKRYTQLPVGTITAIVSALCYLVSAVDLIPDVIPVVGLIDDAGIIGACLLLIKEDVDKYISWRNTNNTNNDNNDNDDCDNSSENFEIVETNKNLETN